MLRRLKCTLSVQERAKLETQVLQRLRGVQDDIVGKDLVTLNRIKNLQVQFDANRVVFDLETPSRVIKQLDQWLTASQRAVEQLDWVNDVKINVTVPRPKTSAAHTSPALQKVANIIAVSSCKGGVGKSTVSVNLAFALQRLGARVGLLDADIYGPSLPLMISPDDRSVRKSPRHENFVLPIEYENVQCMSFGFVNRKVAPGAGGQGAAVMRGPMVSKLIDQLALGTDWGELDYLVIDLPPGTGDIQMSLSQQLAISCAVIVTTPQMLSVIDVEKGISMFQDLKIPTAAIVENMAHFDCIHGHRHYPFGPGHLEQLSKSYKIPHSCTLPILADQSAHSDAGRPIVLDELADPEIRETYSELAQNVATELVRLRHTSATMPIMFYDTSREGIVIRVFDDTGGREVLLSARELRLRCQCAACVNEFTGEPLLDPASIPQDITPSKIQQKGNYAYAVAWSDGHSSSLYTFEWLRKSFN